MFEHDAVADEAKGAAFAAEFLATLASELAAPADSFKQALIALLEECARLEEDIFVWRLGTLEPEARELVHQSLVLRVAEVRTARLLCEDCEEREELLNLVFAAVESVCRTCGVEL